MNLPLCGDLLLATLASGSRGNCTYIGDERRGVLVDCGLSAKQVLARLDTIGLGGARIDAVLVTHEHTDHVGGMGVLDRKLSARQGEPVPFFLTSGTADSVLPKLMPQRPIRVEAGATLDLGPWRLEAHRVPHDTLDPVAWAVERQGVRAGVITDLGHAPRLLSRLLHGLDLAVLEFNHDLTMLLDGPYPWPLKQRIRGRHGHLSNEDAARLLAEVTPGARLRHVVLGHLSEENNRPELAVNAALQAVAGSPITVHVARQDGPLTPLRAPMRSVAVGLPLFAGLSA